MDTLEKSKLLESIVKSDERSYRSKHFDFPIETALNRFSDLIQWISECYVLNKNTASEFIEKLLISYPVPPVYAEYGVNGDIEYLQNGLYLYYLDLFINHDMSLDGVLIPELKGLAFYGGVLTQARQRRFKEKSVHVIICYPPGYDIHKDDI
jgi:hypothetical protein